MTNTGLRSDPPSLPLRMRQHNLSFCVRMCSRALNVGLCLKRVKRQNGNMLPQDIVSLSIGTQVTQSLHCTQGVVITGAAEIGQDKGTLPTQDVFPIFFFKQLLASSFLFSFFFS
ncbi:unnamed protein product [Tetraodon nigroviridis]|uniref:(spotted green pufferfish) hypothetical protein n=1 Tax=Tetraodon nigroviridis TaxID=99883 RepID=Q4RMK2_TETNG|nr:unnamed protein product [Tetraodon nigroviridis]